MKPPKPTAHMILSAEPICTYLDLKCECGKVLEDGLLISSVNLDFRADVPRPQYDKLCGYCRVSPAKPPAVSSIPFYEYWLIEKKAWQAYLEARGKTLGEDEAA